MARGKHRKNTKTGTRGVTSPPAESIECVVCSGVIWDRRRDRHCVPVCSTRAGSASWYDRYVMARVKADRPKTAAHEVGHAIVGWALGWPIEFIDVTITSRGLGQTLFVEHGGRVDDDPLDSATVNLAGYVAERIFAEKDDGPAHATEMVMKYAAHPRPDLAWDAANAWYDVPDRLVADDERRRFVEYAAARAEQILRASWAAVEAVQAALLERERLDGADVEAILARRPSTQDASPMAATAGA